MEIQEENDYYIIIADTYDTFNQDYFLCLGKFKSYGKAQEILYDILKKIELGRQTYIIPPDEEG